MIKALDDRVALNNQTKIPGFGLGVFQIPNDETAEVVKTAIKNGYRLFDTAQVYENEEGTGLGIKEGLKEAGLKREDIFVTSKVWNNHLTYDQTKQAFEASLKKLDLDYLDLYLIHWPGDNAFKESWQALEDLYKEGKVKAIGVSNFQIHHLQELAEFSKVDPVLNQIELHPKLAQKELRDYCKNVGIAVQAWSPLMQGQILDDPTITEIAKKHNKSVAQVILRWDIQQDILLVVKSSHEKRLISNAQIFDFTLDDADMAALNELDESLRVGPDPDQFDFVV